LGHIRESVRFAATTLSGSYTGPWPESQIEEDRLVTVAKEYGVDHEDFYLHSICHLFLLGVISSENAVEGLALFPSRKTSQNTHNPPYVYINI